MPGVYEGDSLRDSMSRVGWKKNMESQIQKGTEHFEVQKYDMKKEDYVLFWEASGGVRGRAVGKS